MPLIAAGGKSALSPSHKLDCAVSFFGNLCWIAVRLVPQKLAA